MGIFDVEYTFDELIRTSSAGIEVASFVQFKEAISKRYKEVFGSDIDIDSTTGDGQFIMMLALLLYNGYYSVYYLNQNIDPASATGKFLDILCSFNNVTRKNASKSYAYLYVDYIGTSSNGYVSTFGQTNSKTQKIECIDTSGKIWVWEEGKGGEGFDTKFYNSKNPKYKGLKLLKFTCEEYGEVSAYADETLKNTKEPKSEDFTKTNHGDISKTVDTSIYPFEVWQATDAVVGSDEEIDEDLRKRRLLEMGNTGLTVFSGIVGGLLGIEGVEEVKLYNNVTEKKSPWLMANDGSRVYYHDVYFCVRYKEGIDIDNSAIGKKIYEKLTPGIVTTPYNEKTEFTSSNYVPLNDGPYGITRKYLVNVYNQILKYNVYWKQCVPISPSIKLNFLYNPEIYNAEQARLKIIKTFKDYVKKLTIYDNFTIPNLLYALNTSDTTVNNQNTFIFLNGKICREDTNKTQLIADITNGYTIKTSPLKDGLYEQLGSEAQYYVSSDTYFKDAKTYYKKSGDSYTAVSPSDYYNKEGIAETGTSFSSNKSYYLKNTSGGEDSYDNKDTYFNYDDMKFEFANDNLEANSVVSTYRTAELYIYTTERKIRFYNVSLNNNGKYEATYNTTLTIDDGAKMTTQQLSTIGITLSNYTNYKFYNSMKDFTGSSYEITDFIDSTTAGSITGGHTFNEQISVYIKKNN